MPNLVDVILLDIDGVLLPFGDNNSDGYNNNETSTQDSCLFPDHTMHALTMLLQQISNLSFNTSSNQVQKGNPVLVLSSTWRARPEFIRDILNSFQIYSDKKGLEDASILQTWKQTNCLDSFFDITDPTYHSTRHDEIMKWVNENTTGDRGKNRKCTKQIVRSWIALDDEDIVNVEGQQHKDMLEYAVQPKSAIGLSPEDVALGIELINKQISRYHEGS